ncbi:MAG TPA: DUF202 domain-containing protein [Bacteroidia bacterium]|nr:DUF202 domain-containing protein [Bacteroidia bacterium]
MAGESTKINKELILRERLALQRTRLANQTTLLSFIRTSLYFIVAGLSIRSLLKLENGLLFEVLFFITAVIIFFIGVFNYFRQNRIIRESERHVGGYKDEYLHEDEV